MELTDELMKELSKMVSQGISEEQIIELLYKRNVSITQSIRAIKNLFEISLGDAKTRVGNSIYWKSTVEDHNEFHEDVFQVLDSESDNTIDRT